MANLHDKLAELEKTQAELFKQRKPIDKKLDRTWNAIQKVQKQIDEEAIKTMEEKGVDWKWILQPANDFGSTEMYRFFDQQVHELGMASGGRWTDTKQPCVKIKLTYGDPESLKKNIAGVRLLAKYYDEIDDGGIPFDIFEHGLSEYAAYTITYDKATKEVTLHTSVYSRTEKKNIGKLPKAMAYLQEHHWYDGKEEERDDDDDGW